jgi:hypothetical protein
MQSQTRGGPCRTRGRGLPRTVNVPVTGFSPQLTEVATLLTDPVGTFPDRSDQLQPLVLPQPSQT